MKFEINPALHWGAAFSVPAVVVDNDYIKLASPEQLRTLLWVFRHAAEQPTVEDIAEALHFTAANAAEYITFWQEKGIFRTEGTVESVPKTAPKPASEKVIPDLPESKPTQGDILERTRESAEIDFLFKEAQKKFGRTIGYDGQCTLLMMHDTYGLPVEVILMMLEYCADVRKTSNAYIAAMGKNWAAEEIDTIEKAEEKIVLLRQCNGLWKELAATAGISAPNPTAVQSEYLRTWNGELGYGFDMIALAYEEMANHCTKLSFAYMNKVLRSWHDKGLKTPQQVAEDNRSFREKKQKQSASEQPPASYDIEEMERRLLYGPIEYKKKD